jgi:hypothetical protein
MIHATPIRRDQEGRYCLNDLHKAAGGEQRHQPRYWLANEQTKALVTAVSNNGNPLIAPVDLSRGRYGGTYVHEDLAIDYAAWISPVFKLEVYRAFKETRKERETDVGRRRSDYERAMMALFTASKMREMAAPSCELIARTSPDELCRTR